MSSNRPTVSNSSTKTPCLVCEGKYDGQRFGIPACKGCQNFFNRNHEKTESLKCRLAGDCEVTKENHKCMSCRLKKCVLVGMRKIEDKPKGMRMNIEALPGKISQDPLQCHMCHKIFKNQYALKYHIAEHDPKSYISCPNCHIGIRKTNLLRHLTHHCKLGGTSKGSRENSRPRKRINFLETAENDHMSESDPERVDEEVDTGCRRSNRLAQKKNTSGMGSKKEKMSGNEESRRSVESNTNSEGQGTAVNRSNFVDVDEILDSLQDDEFVTPIHLRTRSGTRNEARQRLEISSDEEENLLADDTLMDADNKGGNLDTQLRQSRRLAIKKNNTHGDQAEKKNQRGPVKRSRDSEELTTEQTRNKTLKTKRSKPDNMSGLSDSDEEVLTPIHPRNAFNLRRNFRRSSIETENALATNGRTSVRRSGRVTDDELESDEELLRPIFPRNSLSNRYNLRRLRHVENEGDDDDEEAGLTPPRFIRTNNAPRRTRVRRSDPVDDDELAIFESTEEYLNRILSKHASSIRNNLENVEDVKGNVEERAGNTSPTTVGTEDALVVEERRRGTEPEEEQEKNYENVLDPPFELGYDEPYENNGNENADIPPLEDQHDGMEDNKELARAQHPVHEGDEQLQLQNQNGLEADVKEEQMAPFAAHLVDPKIEEAMPMEEVKPERYDNAQFQNQLAFAQAAAMQQRQADPS